METIHPFIELNRKMYADYLKKEKNIDLDFESSYKLNKSYFYRRELMKQIKVIKYMKFFLLTQVKIFKEEITPSVGDSKLNEYWEKLTKE